jgi:tetratricopeptide (TPR) repeat protein
MGAEALDALESDLPNIMAALRTGYTQGLDDLAWQLCEALWPLFLCRKHFAEWTEAYQLGIRAAGRCGNQVALSRMHHHLGFGFHNQGRYDEAGEQGRLPLEAVRAAGHGEAESSALSLIGLAHHGTGHLTEAIQVFREVIAGDELANPPRLRSAALAWRRLGQVLREVGDLTQAIGCMSRGRDLAIALPDPIVAAMTTVHLADALSQAGLHRDAGDLLREVGPTIDDAGSPQYLAVLAWVRGEHARRQDDSDLARTCLTQAHDLFTSLGIAQHAEEVRAALVDLDAAADTQ